MTLFGFSNYQSRRLQFIARQQLSGYAPIGVRYPFLGYSLAIVFLALFYGVHKIDPHLDGLHLFLAVLAGAALVSLALVPLRILIWLRWYRAISLEDKAEFWWINKRRAAYASAVAILAVGFIVVLIVLARMQSR